MQIETDSVQELPSYHTGGVYGLIVPTAELPREAIGWQTCDITLLGRNITMVQDNQTFVNDLEIPDITGRASRRS